LNRKIKQMNEDVKSVTGVLQTAKDKGEVEKLKMKMQGNN